MHSDTTGRDNPSEAGRAEPAASDTGTPARPPDEGPPEPPRQGETTPASPGLFQRILRRTPTEREPPASRCVILGPSGSGKTLLLMSLSRCVDARSHSFARDYTTTIAAKNRDFKTIDGWLERCLTDGLLLQASDVNICFEPELTLHVTRRRGPFARQFDTRFRTFDGVGGLLLEHLGENNPEFRACRARLLAALDECDTVLLCLPIVRRVPHEQEEALQELIQRFIRQPRIRRLVVCFTMYEKLGLGLGRDAFRALANRGAARERMAGALRDRLAPLDNVLRQLDGRGGRKVWCVPVSTYGFVPRNGGANLALFGQDELLRTMPEPPLAYPGVETPYRLEESLKVYWRPFLTVDPFVFIATGDRRGTLIHAYSELHG